mmetsp:Transcript_9733/g.15937  ORF Transcript_9733/g.15937 Transcript_9733/m.15937 type:complete len:1193 (+) Transcript_9733:95-3673(+)|eukprot:CAMPEP_0184661488 /NCGR_PEP_ID=MMETSP0308-20130426/38652_1 /TAXON_ID=38269 /ORGANISM="Gloeochaete witrockiana, Strain SAG 46.84" /LENGTH=1192 /DNA_ID=CAMNT_0027102831 /DNA_START=27 /DNA_END=3605 /DNA_ORIENTATION=-
MLNFQLSTQSHHISEDLSRKDLSTSIGAIQSTSVNLVSPVPSSKYFGDERKNGILTDYSPNQRQPLSAGSRRIAVAPVSLSNYPSILRRPAPVSSQVPASQISSPFPSTPSPASWDASTAHASVSTLHSSRVVAGVPNSPVKKRARLSVKYSKLADTTGEIQQWQRPFEEWHKEAKSAWRLGRRKRRERLGLPPPPELTPIESEPEPVPLPLQPVRKGPDRAVKRKVPYPAAIAVSPTFGRRSSMKVPTGTNFVDFSANFVRALCRPVDPPSSGNLGQLSSACTIPLTSNTTPYDSLLAPSDYLGSIYNQQSSLKTCIESSHSSESVSDTHITVPSQTPVDDWLLLSDEIPIANQNVPTGSMEMEIPPSVSPPLGLLPSKPASLDALKEWAFQQDVRGCLFSVVNDVGNKHTPPRMGRPTAQKHRSGYATADSSDSDIEVDAEQMPRHSSPYIWRATEHAWATDPERQAIELRWNRLQLLMQDTDRRLKVAQDAYNRYRQQKQPVVLADVMHGDLEHGLYSARTRGIAWPLKAYRKLRFFPHPGLSTASLPMPVSTPVSEASHTVPNIPILPPLQLDASNSMGLISEGTSSEHEADQQRMDLDMDWDEETDLSAADPKDEEWDPKRKRQKLTIVIPRHYVPAGNGASSAVQRSGRHRGQRGGHSVRRSSSQSGQIAPSNSASVAATPRSARASKSEVCTAHVSSNIIPSGGLSARRRGEKEYGDMIIPPGSMGGTIRDCIHRDIHVPSWRVVDVTAMEADQDFSSSEEDLSDEAFRVRHRANEDKERAAFKELLKYYGSRGRGRRGSRKNKTASASATSSAAPSAPPTPSLRPLSSPPTTLPSPMGSFPLNPPFPLPPLDISAPTPTPLAESVQSSLVFLPNGAAAVMRQTSSSDIPDNSDLFDSNEQSEQPARQSETQMNQVSASIVYLAEVIPADVTMKAELCQSISLPTSAATDDSCSETPAVLAVSGGPVTSSDDQHSPVAPDANHLSPPLSSCSVEPSTASVTLTLTPSVSSPPTPTNTVVRSLSVRRCRPRLFKAAWQKENECTSREPNGTPVQSCPVSNTPTLPESSVSQAVSSNPSEIPDTPSSRKKESLQPLHPTTSAPSPSNVRRSTRQKRISSVIEDKAGEDDVNDDVAVEVAKVATSRSRRIPHNIAAKPGGRPSRPSRKNITPAFLLEYETSKTRAVRS